MVETACVLFFIFFMRNELPFFTGAVIPKQIHHQLCVRFLACNGCSAWRVLGAAKTVIRVP